MATYANATNPFLKAAERKQQNKKSAPGMARPLSLLDELTRSKEAKAANQDEESASEASGAAPEVEHLDENNNNEQLPGTLQGQVDLLERDIDEEIAQTCRSLVDQAASVTSAAQAGPEPALVNVSQRGPPMPALVKPEVKQLDGAGQEEDEKANDDGFDDDDDDDDDGEEEEGDEDGNGALKGQQRDKSGDRHDGRQLEGAAREAGASGRQQHLELIKKLRLQLRDLERYAHERGELERIPASVLLERQTVILDTLRKKLPHFSLDKDKIERLELEQLKRQADEEINNLIDPLITKEHLLKQLQTQLTNLEKYVSHLHGTIGLTNGCCQPERAPAAATKRENCSCALHGCSSSPAGAAAATSPSSSSAHSSPSSHSSPGAAATDQSRQSIFGNDTLPKTSRLIKGIMAQLICSDMKVQEAMKMERRFAGEPANGTCTGEPERTLRGNGTAAATTTTTTSGTGPSEQQQQRPGAGPRGVITTKLPQFHDGAAWTLHLDRVILATDSLSNIYTLAQEATTTAAATTAAATTTTATSNRPADCQATMPTCVDHSLVESVVRRQLVPAMRDLLAYGLIDPSSLPPRHNYVSFIFDPYYLLSSLTCLPGTQTSSGSRSELAANSGATLDKVHVWHLIADYYESRNEPNFRNSSVKTLSQSFNLTSSLDGPIKITSKQALLIAIDDIIERLAKCKPNGPESHLELFTYTALNQGKLATWIRIIFRNKAIMRKYYHNFSFVCQPDKMDRFLALIDGLGRFEFKLNTDTEGMDQFVGAF